MTQPVPGHGGLRSLLSVRSLAGQIFLVEIVIVLLLVATGAAALVLQTQSSNTNEARHVTRVVAETFAQQPGLVPALDSVNPSGALQPRAEQVRKATGVDAVNVLTTGGIQLTSPDPRQIGSAIVMTPHIRYVVIPELKAGRTVTFTFDQPGYHSITTAVPVFGPGHSPKGVVAVNIQVQHVNSWNGHLPLLLGVAAGSVLLAAGATVLASRRLLRQTLGLGPADLRRMYEHHDAVLHAVREGVLILGNDGRITLLNDEARRLLGLPPEAEYRQVSELGLDEDTVELLVSEQPVTDRLHWTGDRLLAVNKRPTAPYGGFPGNVVTLRDTTELHAVTGRAEVTGQRLRLLYEAGVRIGTTLDMTVTSDELAALVVPGFADALSVDLLDAVIRGEEPTAAGRQLRRTALRSSDARWALNPVDTVLTPDASTPQAMSLGGGPPLLVKDIAAAHTWRSLDPPAAERIVAQGLRSHISVPLRARGVALGIAGFWRGPDSPPFDEDDLTLAEELAARAAVSIDNARRYTREHDMAMTLQRSLLPSTLPEHTALDVAFRYLPAHAGVGGDWFDVIALPGFRTALVVGDVVGHGIHAAVSMGRLRTAVANFSALDLPPEEVLGRLDELVSRLDTEASGGSITGSTCLYAVYDPVDGVCTIARAGHPGPALLAPDGSVTYPEVAVSPPLGVGGHPFATTQVPLAPGSHLVMFSDGLVESRTRDLGVGLERLRGALAGDAGRTPEEICRTVTEALLPPRPADDVALLVARTRRLDPSQIASWEVPSDPAQVAPVRAECGRRLHEWGLDDIDFTTELILSELVTNAIRHGSPPVRVRLLHGPTLVCEVSDGSSTSPHLRWAAGTDEGGRGIFLVAQLAHRWGTRYTPGGKVIWSEQLLHDESRSADGLPIDTLVDRLADDLSEPPFDE